MGPDPAWIREGLPKNAPWKLSTKEEWEAAEGAWGSIQKELGARQARREACVCWERGGGPWAGDVAVEICVCKEVSEAALGTDPREAGRDHCGGQSRI